jgi:[ribosomal protein S5]-alanine N-acetyltransferase
MKLELFPCDPKLAPFLKKWREEPTALRYNPLRALTVFEVESELRASCHDLSDIREKEKYRWFVHADGELVGQVALANISLMMGTAEVGYLIGEDFKGRGIATGALRLLIADVFNKTALRRLQAFVHEGNLASCRVVEKLGFVREGLLREHFIVRGEAVNEIAYGLLKKEWKPS